MNINGKEAKQQTPACNYCGYDGEEQRIQCDYCGEYVCSNCMIRCDTPIYHCSKKNKTVSNEDCISCNSGKMTPLTQKEVARYRKLEHIVNPIKTKEKQK